MGVLKTESEIYLPLPLNISLAAISDTFLSLGFEPTHVLEVLGRLKFQRSLFGNGNTAAMLSNGYVNLFEATCQMFPIDETSTRLVVSMTGFSEEETWVTNPIDLLDEVLKALDLRVSTGANPEAIRYDSAQDNFQNGEADQGSTPF